MAPPLPPCLCCDTRRTKGLSLQTLVLPPVPLPPENGYAIVRFLKLHLSVRPHSPPCFPSLVVISWLWNTVSFACVSRGHQSGLSSLWLVTSAYMHRRFPNTGRSGSRLPSSSFPRFHCSSPQEHLSVRASIFLFVHMARLCLVFPQHFC